MKFWAQKKYYLNYRLRIGATVPRRMDSDSSSDNEGVAPMDDESGLNPELRSVRNELRSARGELALALRAKKVLMWACVVSIACTLGIAALMIQGTVSSAPAGSGLSPRTQREKERSAWWKHQEDTNPLEATCPQKDEIRAALASASHPPLPAIPAEGCPPVHFFDPPRDRYDLGKILNSLNMRVGVEVGVQSGSFSRFLLKEWKTAELFIQVDVWEQQSTNYHDAANVGADAQLKLQKWACRNAVDMQDAGFLQTIVQCRGLSTDCAKEIPDESLDFIYIDARHDRKGVLEDLQYYWPKLRAGGIIAGHDYLFLGENKWKGGPVVFPPVDRSSPVSANDYRINYDGTIDETGQVVRGAVNDFFSGVASESPHDLQACPRQPVVAYREVGVVAQFSGLPPSWVVRK